jgi:vancomycin resistance protein YoaR
MSVYSATRKRKRNYPSFPSILQIAFSLFIGFLLFIFMVVLIAVFYDMRYSGRIYPGVSVAGIDLSGLEPSQAIALLEEQIVFPQQGKIVFQDGEKLWVARPSDLGLSVDVRENVKTAYYLGRSGNPFARLGGKIGAWYSGRDLAPLLVYDQRAAYQFISDIAAEIDQPIIEASLALQGAQVLEVPGQIGREVDIEANMTLLSEQISSLTDGLIPLKIEETQPVVVDVSQEAEQARQILSAPLMLLAPDEVQEDLGPWAIPPEQLAGKLSFELVESSDGYHYDVRLDEDAMYTYLNALSPDVDRQSRNARFIFNDDTRLLEVIQPAVIGRSIDIYSTIQEIDKQLISGEHSASLEMVFSDPEITDDTTGEELGVTELVSSETTYFRGSSAERLQNIETAAANFHGLLVPPGATFSMSANMKSVSLDNGYAEALIIFGGRTIKGVGGGVCQVSTTLFRTAFFGGFPIIERHPHAYRVGYYEQSYGGYDQDMAGLDATVFVPMVDFKFSNDTPYWLLMETYFNPTSRSLTWKFYSTSDGRTVQWETTGPENIVEPPDPVYEENPELEKGEIDQVDWAAEGADVTVTRVVYRDGQVYFSDSFTTYYLPWGDVFQYGPGTKLPKKNKKQQIIQINP